MKASTKVSIGLLIVLLAVMAATVLGRGGSAVDQGTRSMPILPSGAESPADSSELAGLRADANLPPCPAPTGAPAAGPLAGVQLECMGDGSVLDLGAALAGKPAVLNLWAYWCGPCREELPAMAEFEERAGDAVTVLTVHKDRSQERGLAMLAELGVRLPGVADPGARVAAAVSAPNVLPVTVLVRADGSVAKVLAVPFTDADQIAAAVQEHLGVTT